LEHKHLFGLRFAVCGVARVSHWWPCPDWTGPSDDDPLALLVYEIIHTITYKDGSGGGGGGRDDDDQQGAHDCAGFPAQQTTTTTTIKEVGKVVVYFGLTTNYSRMNQESPGQVWW
jgi:hypothetical protein